MSHLVRLGEVLRHRKGSIVIDDAVEYKRCRVQLHRRGVEVRDVVPGTVIRTKKQQICKAGDFIVAEMDAKFGGYGFLSEALEGAIVSSHYYLFEVIEEKMMPEYLAVINKTDILQNQIKAKGSTNYSAVRPADVLDWVIPLPSLTEQQRIINEVDVIEKEQQLMLPEFDQQLAYLTQLRQALLREAMQGRLLPQDPTDEPAAVLLRRLQAARATTGKKGKGKVRTLFENELEAIEGPYEIPPSWAWCTLGTISDNVEYGTSEKASLDSSGVPVLRMNNIQNGEILTDNLKYLPQSIADLPKLFLKTDDLLFNRTNSAELVGKSGIYKGENDKVTFASYLIRVHFPMSVTAYFTNYFINSILCRTTEIEPFIIQQNGQANFNGTKLKEIRIPLPPLAEQHRIVAKLEQLLGHCDALEQRICESRRLAERLLATALREALAWPPAVTSPEAAELELAEATQAPAHRSSRRGTQLALGTLLD